MFHASARTTAEELVLNRLANSFCGLGARSETLESPVLSRCPNPFRAISARSDIASNLVYVIYHVFIYMR